MCTRFWTIWRQVANQLQDQDLADWLLSLLESSLLSRRLRQVQDSDCKLLSSKENIRNS